MKFKTLELTKDNHLPYIDQIASLEQLVLANMESNGQIGQLFPTGKDDILEYIYSPNNSVIVALDDADKVLAATYITQGQIPFTYNDITKYFKYGSEYQLYVKNLYPTIEEYRMDMLEAYKFKIEAFNYASNKLLEQYPKYNGSINNFLFHELHEENNHFHEKSMLRENLNKYMSMYIQQMSKITPKLQELYEKFYWITSDEISNEFNKKTQLNSESMQNYEYFLHSQHKECEYKDILKKGPLVIYESPDFNVQKYYSANTENSVELDTYITDPNVRHAGLARVLLLDGITKHMRRHFSNYNNSEIFLCSTLHRDNLSSKYVSEFFGLTDSLFVKRRDGRNREVHICNVKRDEFENYLEYISKKMAVLYGYNPNNIKISNKDEAAILTEQINYENCELSRLNRVRMEHGKVYTGNIDYSVRKTAKIEHLYNRLTTINEKLYIQLENTKGDNR